MADDTDETARLLAESARVRPVLEKFADKWTIQVLAVICAKPSRFNAIRRRLDGITHKTLADALKRLERHGLVTRAVLPTRPVGVEYALTPLGASLQKPCEALHAWALAHGDALGSAGGSAEVRGPSAAQATPDQGTARRSDEWTR